MRKIDKLCDLIEGAHSLFADIYVFEVIDIDQPEAIEILHSTFDNPNPEHIARYLTVIERLR